MPFRPPPGATPPALTDPPLRFHWPLALAFAALCVAVGYPGRLNADSLFAVIAATTAGAANNWHSATLGWLWSLPAPLLGQPAGALLVQSILFGLFAGFLPRPATSPRGYATLALEIALRLALVGAFTAIGKDVVLLAAALIAVQLTRQGLHAGFGPLGLAGIAAATLLFLLVKAPAFMVPVVAFALLLSFARPTPARWAMLVVLALGIGLLAIPLNRVVDRQLFAARDVHPDKQLVIFDLAGISVRTGTDQFAAVPGWPTAALPPVARCYLPYMWDAFAPWGPCRAYSAAYDRLDAAMTQRWIAAIAHHPIAYAQHRLTYAGYLMTSRDHRSWGLGGEAINDAASPAARAELATLMQGMNAAAPIARWHPNPATAPFAWAEAALFRYPGVQYVGLFMALAILLAGWIDRHNGPRLGALIPAALAVGNVAMLLVFGVADPARYLLPTVVLAYVAGLALLVPPGLARRSASVRPGGVL